ncbi:MAG: tetratricopeptide repeat protein [Planctomycetota bacterium]
MQRYRVNYTLLVCLLVGALAIGGGLWGVLKWQRSKNANRYLQLAEKYEAEGDLREASNSLAGYYNLRREDVDAFKRLTKMRLELMRMPNSSLKDRQNGYGTLEQFVRNNPQHDDMRQELVELLLTQRRYKDALTHINVLLSKKPNDNDLNGERLTCMIQAGKLKEAIKVGYQLVGYDSITAEFDREKAKTPDAPEVHQQLAAALRRDNQDPELADSMLDVLVEDNPENAEAYLARGRYLSAIGEAEEAKADFTKALELAPDNADVLLSQAQVYASAVADSDDPDQREADLDVAYELLQRAASQNAEDWRTYRMLARIERLRGDMKAAVEHYKTGEESVPRQDKPRLSFYKIKLEIDSQDLDDVDKEIEELDALGIRQEYVDYLRARKLFAEEQWFKAAEGLAKVRPVLQGDFELFVELNVALGICYERLGQWERGKDSYNQVLQRAPANAFAMAGKQRCERQINPIPIAGNADDGADSQISINRLIIDELKKPEDEQRWAPIMDSIETFTEGPLVAPGAGSLLRAEVYVRRKMYAEAQREIAKALNEFPDDLRVWRAALRVIASNPEKGPTVALAKLDEKLVEKFGDSPLLRLDRADFLMQIGGEDLVAELMELAEGVDDWEKRQKVQLWKGLATRFQQMRNQEARLEALNKVASLAPNELPTLLSLFELAIESGDKQRIDETQKAILDLVGSKDNETYLFTEARRLLAEYAKGERDNTALDQADTLVERALVQRKDWHRLYQLQGFIALARNQKARALNALSEGAKRGPANGRQLLVHVSLLIEQGRYKDAAELLERLPIGARQQLLGRNYAEILYNTGRVEEAVASAKAVSESAPNNGAVQLWLGRFLARVSGGPNLPESEADKYRESASEALSKAVELTSANPSAWLALIQLQLAQKDLPSAEQTLREAQLVLPEDLQDQLVARSYEWIGRWFDAETVYRRLYEANPKNTAFAQQLANFYLGSRYPKTDGEMKAIPLLNRLLTAAVTGDVGEEETEVDTALADNEDEDAAAEAAGPEVDRAERARKQRIEATAAWARRTSAKILANKKDYQKTLKAQTLLKQNERGGVLGPEDKLLKAQILASRPEPTSRLEAIELFEEIDSNRPLALQDGLRLGQLYFVTGQMEKARDYMYQLVAQSKGAPAARVAFIRMLLDSGDSADLAEASRQVSRLKQAAPTSPTTLQLVVRVAVKMGKQREAARAIAGLLPKDPKNASAAQLLPIARLLTELGDFDRAENTFKFAASKEPAASLFYAEFLGLHRDPDQAFALLDGWATKLKPQVLIRTGIEILRARRDEIGDKHDDRVDGWLTKALREDPESIVHLLQLAELRSLQKRYEETIAVYRKLLALPDLTGQPRAIVLNNLGYMMAVTTGDSAMAEEAMGYVSEAVDILGPQSDILDTRGVVLTILGRYDEAKEDLALSLTENPTASKFFHKARAHMLAGESTEATKAWNRAIELGLDRESVAVAEREQFDQLQEQIDRLAQSAAR